MNEHHLAGSHTVTQSHGCDHLNTFATVFPLELTSMILPMIIILQMLILAFATVILSRNSTVHSHGTLAWISFLSSCVAIGATFGLGAWMRIPFSNLIITLAFLLLGA